METGPYKVDSSSLIRWCSLFFLYVTVSIKQEIGMAVPKGLQTRGGMIELIKYKCYPYISPPLYEA